MANSIVKLTLESNQYERGIKQAQRSWNEFMRGIGISVGKFTAVGAAIGTVTGALKVAKDAFFKSEASLDEWGRTVKATESVYSNFLLSLNNSDISGFLSNMDDIVSAAKEAYNAMDDLKTFSAFNQVNVARGQAGYAKALDEYKLNPTVENKAALKKANQAVIDNLRDQQQKTEMAYQKKLEDIVPKNLSQDLREEFVNILKKGSYIDLQVAKSSYSQGKGLNTGAQYYNGDRVYDGKRQERFTGKWTEMSETDKKEFELARALSQVNDTTIKEVQSLGAQAEALNQQIYQQDRSFNRMAGNNQRVVGGGSGRGGSGRGGGGNAIDYASDSIAAQEALVQKLTNQWKKASAELRDGYLQQLNEAKNDLDYMTGKRTVVGPMGNAEGVLPNTIKEPTKLKDAKLSVVSPLKQMEDEVQNLIAAQVQFGSFNSEIWQALQEQIDATTAKIRKFKGESDTTKVADESAKSWQSAASAVQSVGSALQNIEDPGAKVAGLIGQAIANIALGFAQATAAASAGGPVAWIAAIVGGMATMISTIEAIHSATGFSEGGMVQGSTFSGDKIPAMLNAGEVVLNRAQAGNLASQLQGGGLQNLHLEASVSGTQLRFVLNNESQVRGRGQYVTTNFRG